MFRRSNKPRKGTSLVELAVCLPVLVVVVVGAIEMANFIFLKQAVTAAAYESVREAIRRDGTDESAETIAESVLAARRCAESTVDINPSADVPRGELVTVTVTAPSTANRVVSTRFVGGMSVTASTTMAKE